MRLPKFSVNNFCVRRRPSPRIIAKHAARNRTSTSSANWKWAQQELDESELWLELLSDSGVIKPRLIQPLLEETNELIAIFVTMTKKVKTRRKSTI
jgi:four helix bundle protein